MAKQIIIEGGENFDLFLTALRAVHGAVSPDDEMFRDYFKQWVCGVIDMYRVGTAISDAEDEIGNFTNEIIKTVALSEVIKE